ncbi:hypothetical protein H9Q72_009159 [Fusarium xylarioides]|uniref:Uncharacterized protein n=1 Tax=Fusarium xylarioides TaxID=221167 RepID=A0A9P7L319_9HYPO|nr:hypothetical protein H9Q72_009159 [Fusarium xylarioides]
MTKFDSSDEPGYIMINWLLQKWVREIQEHKSGGPDDPTELSNATKVQALDTSTELHILHRLLGLSAEDDKGTREDSRELSKPLLSPEIVRWLASKELLSSIQQESLTISTAPLLESFTISTTDQCSTWSLSEDDQPFLRKVDVPIHRYSPATYEFLGYEREVAEYLWHTFNSSENPSFSLFEVSKAYLEDNTGSPAKSKHDWDNLMGKIGIGGSLRKSIPDSHLDNIRSTESYEFWLRTAFGIRWQELQTLNEDLLKVMKRTAPTGEQPRETGSSGPSHDQGTDTEQAQCSGRQDTAQPSAEQYSGANEEQGPVAGTTSATKTSEHENKEITLWRGGTKASIENAIDNGRLRVNLILSAPGDFSGTMRVPYFTTQRNTASLYGAFHATLSQIGTPPYLLNFQVDKEWLKTLQHRCLWASGDGNNVCDIDMPNCPEHEDQGVEDMKNRSWEHVVFTCRRGGRTPPFLRQRSLDT